MSKKQKQSFALGKSWIPDLVEIATVHHTVNHCQLSQQQDSSDREAQMKKSFHHRISSRALTTSYFNQNPFIIDLYTVHF